MEPIYEQIELGPTLLSRFDLIFTMMDEVDPDTDADLAEHILEANEAGERRARGESIADYADRATPEIEPDLLRAYTACARETMTPTLSEAAKERLKEYYCRMREQGGGDDSPIPVTARKLEALVRLAEASARLRLSETVTEADAERVIEIVDKSLRDVGMDPETGKLDVDVIETGSSKSQRDRTKAVFAAIQELERKTDSGAPREDVIEALDGEYSRSKIIGSLDKLREEGRIYSTDSDEHYRPV